MTGISELQQYFLELEGQDRFSGVALTTRGIVELFKGGYGYASRAWKIKNSCLSLLNSLRR